MTPAQIALNASAIRSGAARLEAGDPRLPQRVWNRIRVDESGCWIWTGHIDHTGYGRTKRLEDWRKSIASHRLVYEALVGPIPDGLDLDHLCRVRACCSPAHLEAVTRRVNVLRGQTVSAANAVKTHCPAGHEYAGTNLVIDERGRKCRECLRLRAVEKRARNPKPPRTPVTHCKRGHAFEGDNLRLLKSGKRACVACSRMYQTEKRDRIREVAS